MKLGLIIGPAPGPSGLNAPGAPILGAPGLMPGFMPCGYP